MESQDTYVKRNCRRLCPAFWNNDIAALYQAGSKENFSNRVGRCLQQHLPKVEKSLTL